MHHHSMHDSCGCGPMSQCSNRCPIVCPVQHCVVDNFFCENQDYIHPTHILVRNNHLLNNNHYFPYMVSEQNNFQTQEFAYPQGSSPDYNWMENMNQQGAGAMGEMEEGGMAGMNGQMPMMDQGQMPGMNGQMPMMNQGQMPGMNGQMPMMNQGQMPGMNGQMPMMNQGQMPMMGPGFGE
ncbi:hypothetical protein GLW04_05730 [Halobacillus litoralis]|uniref:Spore coat protein n=1 Tax=Halobacillus litoralis TaxID=45668 RepID=A0A845DSP4_9BACI|nr:MULTISPECIES: CotD family spore coat protein [Halobacillus]MYL19382.1 hypothetical protein [Halobacillus litoralis]MYL28527.1 hypothetical protein [Halobacillus halophilus]MYL38042.1 hypothetical protein [Halobacillus litoralis]